MSKAVLSVSNRGIRRTSLWAAGFVAAMLLAPQPGMSAPGGVFAPFLGSWKGSGQVTVNDGHKERISCRATYSASDNGASLTQSLTCAGDAYRFQVQSYVEATGQNLLGHWEEENRKVAGQLTGQVSGGQFVGNISGPTFTAQMSLNATERQQIVSIKPHGASYSSVDIVLDRQR
jgi:hypothetical protein